MQSLCNTFNHLAVLVHAVMWVLKSCICSISETGMVIDYVVCDSSMSIDHHSINHGKWNSCM